VAPEPDAIEAADSNEMRLEDMGMDAVGAPDCAEPDRAPAAGDSATADLKDRMDGDFSANAPPITAGLVGTAAAQLFVSNLAALGAVGVRTFGVVTPFWLWRGEPSRAGALGLGR